MNNFTDLRTFKMSFLKMLPFSITILIIVKLSIEYLNGSPALERKCRNLKRLFGKKIPG